MPLGCPAPEILKHHERPQPTGSSATGTTIGNGQTFDPFRRTPAAPLPGFSQVTVASPRFLLTGNQAPKPADDSDLLDGKGNDSSDMSALESIGPAASQRQPTNDAIPGANHGLDKPSRDGLKPGEDPHAAVFAENCYPSAVTCAKCHQKIYDEWRVSSHAYATISPMFQKFEQKITDLSSGTIGTFCIRCHAPVAVQMNFPRYGSYVDAPPVLREGITCVACHRVREAYGKSNGERRIEPGDILQPVYGSFGGDGVAKAIADKGNLKIKTDLDSKLPGQVIHLQGIKFDQLSHSEFCYTCHQVAVYPGISLEVVWAQYRASPAFRKGVTCQDCHMGAVPGKALGYDYGPAAEMSGKTVNNNRKHASHLFYGPGQSIAHPGLFPINEKAQRWNLDQWLTYDWRAGWGTPEFESLVKQQPQAYRFPESWKTVDERKDARKVLDENFRLLQIKEQASIAVLEAAAKVDGPFFRQPPQVGQDLAFEYCVSNISDGHNLPTGSLGAQPQMWLNVVLIGPDGTRRWESGYLDANGDLADMNSVYVNKRQIPADHQLFNLQTKFLITGVKGPDRELCLPINIDTDPLPYLRPGAQPITVLNHPPTIRMEAHSIPANGSKKAKYNVPAELVCQPGTYRLSVRLRSRIEPLYFMRFVDATPEMQRRMLERTLNVAQHSYTFEIR